MLYAPVHPLQLYALASKYDLSDLVACTSMHLLSFPLDQITDKVAEEIDPVYLARLLTLQRRRMKALTQFMCVSPLLHQPTPSCDIDAQKSVIKAWTFASAYLVWNAKPYLSPGYIDSVLRSLPDHALFGLAPPPTHTQEGICLTKGYSRRVWSSTRILDRAGGTRLSISPTFGATSLGSSRPSVDMILLTSDSIIFYIDEATLLRVSANSFKSLLPLTTEDKSQRVLFMRDISSDELDIMLQAVYNVPGSTIPGKTDIQVLLSAVDQFMDYGISAATFITSTSHLYQYLLACAPLHPLEIYALAAQHDIGSLATTASVHTLVLELSDISEELSKRMGSVYLLKLFQLHITRTETLKKLLAADLGYHNTTNICDIRKSQYSRYGNFGLANHCAYMTLHIV
ncbi:hypothetical protein AAF712_010323 [Marasmius tenuissimus]|uniref:BTB domain-containing protein n=1 Tax=Marasmius tenuissimus TaxID=585030 RepID=A0ABR2ZN97_9AGAR